MKVHKLLVTALEMMLQLSTKTALTKSVKLAKIDKRRYLVSYKVIFHIINTIATNCG